MGKSFFNMDVFQRYYQVCYFNTHRNGWGCMVHHAVFCLMAAFASRRMLVIDKTDEIFVSESCQNSHVPYTKYDWPTRDDEERVVKFCPDRLSKFQEVKVGKFNTSMVPFL